MEAKSDGNGLVNMKRRAASINGDIIIETKIGSGTTIKLTVEV